MFRVKRDQRDRGCSELFCEEGEVGCRSGSRYSTVAIGIRRICHSFIGLKRVTEGLLSSSHRQMAEKAFHMFLLSQMLCCRETATRSGTEILTIGVICGSFFTSCQTEQRFSEGVLQGFVWCEMSETYCFCRQARGFTALVF